MMGRLIALSKAGRASVFVGVAKSGLWKVNSPLRRIEVYRQLTITVSSLLNDSASSS
jgi:hypothetical protein